MHNRIPLADGRTPPGAVRPSEAVSRLAAADDGGPWA